MIKAVKRTAGVFLGGVAVAASLTISAPTASACYDWDRCDSRPGYVLIAGPPGRPAVEVEHWKRDWVWNWRCDDGGRWDWYLDRPGHWYGGGHDYYPNYGHNSVDVGWGPFGGYVGIG